jgi:phenylpropionate dioxygenase-like ring-hydroxylating dioxygenase large terminal subunit
MKRIPLPPVPNGWYKALYSDELVRGDVKPLSILEREFAVYRGEDGVVRMTDAYCPHLGAHLAHGGTVEGNALVCPFHNWKWEGESGRCLDVPYSDQIPARAQIRTFQVREQNGYVMFWFDSEGAEPSFEIDVIPEVSDPTYRLYKRARWEVSSHIQEIYENVVDVAHFRSLHQMDVHSVTWEPVGSSDAPTVRLHINLERDSAAQSAEGGQTEIESYMYGPGLQVTRLSGKMKGVSVNSLTPIADEKLEVGHAYYVQTSDAASEKEVEAFWDYYMDDHALDFNIWNNKRYLEKPVLADGDGDVASFRRWFRQFYPASQESGVEAAG